MVPPKLFAGTSNPKLARAISEKSKIPLGKIEIGTFSDGEIDVWVQDDVNNSSVFILQSNSYPVNDNIIELSLIADALRRGGAHKITAVIPYFGYSRKEKQSRTGEPISAKVIADLIISTGINKVICLDLHADAIVGFFAVPVIYLSAQEVLAQRLKKENYKNPIVVSPDVGGVKRARNFAAILSAPLAVIEKQRYTVKRDSTEVLSVSGEVSGGTAIIVDDVISTGSTIIESAKALIEKGVKKIVVCATHGVFAANGAEKLDKSVVDKIFVTDSIAQNHKSKKIEVVSTVEMFANCLSQEVS